MFVAYTTLNKLLAVFTHNLCLSTGSITLLFWRINVFITGEEILYSARVQFDNCTADIIS